MSEFNEFSTKAFRVIENGRVSVPPGCYYLGDPIRPFGDGPNWDRLLESCNNFIGNPIGSVDGTQVVAFHTAHGDGFYEFDDGEVNVDTGLIGLVPATAARRPPEGMFLVTFDEPVDCHADGGTLWFGHIRFDTHGANDDEEETV